MKQMRWMGLVALMLGSRPARAQVPVTPAADHAKLLASGDARLAANKRLVYDFWRSVLEAGHLELAERYLNEGYIQHNPNVPTGRAGFITFFSRFARPQPVAERIQAPLVSIMAEGDLVALTFVETVPDTTLPSGRYTTTSADLFRVVNGRIVEHWDTARRGGR